MATQHVIIVMMTGTTVGEERRKSESTSAMIEVQVKVTY